jgi:hypothetical protein
MYLTPNNYYDGDKDNDDNNNINNHNLIEKRIIAPLDENLHDVY